MFRTLLISMFLTSAAFADVWTVDDDGKADFDNIQAAVDAASDGDEIVVMPGTYTSTQDGHVVNMLGKAVTLRSSDPSDPDVVAATIVDGEDARRGIACFNNETSKTIISGFTITNGFSVDFDYNGDGDIDWWENSGGGMYNNNSSPTLTDCVFDSNVANDGGGMFNSGSSPTLTNCAFNGNDVSHSGAGMDNSNSSPTLTGCTFTGNTAAVDGAGMVNDAGSDPELTNCTFDNNIALYGGGVMYNVDSNPTLTDCTFTNNSANNEGGVMFSHNNCNTTLINCTFTGNTADQGGGMFNYGNSSHTLDGCTFTNNAATNYGGGIHNANDSDVTLTNTTVCANTPDQISGDWTDNGGNTIADECPVADVDGDGVDDTIDNCYLYNPDQADCNGNGIGDVCDLADFTSPDCDQNGVPDECQTDCDGDGWIDPCDNDGDIDQDGIPDNCEADCNGNGIPDHFEIELGLAEDCNGNLIPDECDLEIDPSLDCDENSLLDACEISDDPSLDCDNNGVLDSCDLMDHPVEETKLLASDGTANDQFGHSSSISSDGSTAIVGAHLDDDNGNNSGSAYIYSLVNGIWEETKLLASDGASGDYFGKNVSISSDGSTAIVGAYIDDDNGTDSGSAYIYRFDGKQWIEETKLTASDGGSHDYFGYSVSISSDGTTALVGASRIGSTGSAYIYKLVGDAWQETKLLASDGANEDHFGTSVSISNDGTTVIVGVRYDDDNGTDSGSAYIYSLVNGIWEEAKLLASDGVSTDDFGYMVSISSDGTTAIVGAVYDDDNGTDSGSAYIYSLVNGIWEETKLLASDGASDDFFGHSVSISGDGTSAIVGADYDDDNGNGSGSAYIYRFDGTTWIETKLLASDGAITDYFSNSVSISSDGTTAIVGAIYDDDNGNNSGSAYVFGLGSDADCDGNGNIDSCDIEEDPSLDCDGDGILDSCQSFADCNENGIPDCCDLQDPTNDQNNNWQLDVCECLADTSGPDGSPDGIVGIEDILYLIGYWGSSNPAADFDFNGVVDVEDLLILITSWGECDDWEESKCLDPPIGGDG